MRPRPGFWHCIIIAVNYTPYSSDNDMLSEIVAALCKAKRLIILSGIGGLYESDPKRFITS